MSPHLTLVLLSTVLGRQQPPQQQLQQSKGTKTLGLEYGYFIKQELTSKYCSAVDASPP